MAGRNTREDTNIPAHYRLLYEPGDYLTAADLVAPDGSYLTPTVTIERIVQGYLPIAGSSKTERKPVMYFAGKRKKWAYGKTCGATIAALHGENPRLWIGKRITLFRSTCKSKEGPNTPCIRVMNKIPPTKGGAELHEPPEIDNGPAGTDEPAQAGETA